MERFRESFTITSRGFEKIQVDENLQEKYGIPVETESSRLLESSLNKIHEPFPLYKFPVSRYGNKNHNGRKYSEKLWENVINKQANIWKNFPGLMDHPPSDSDGEFKNAAIVWLDMIIDKANQLIWAIGTFVGPFGRLAQEIVDKGGRIGFSSSGFGELEFDGETVNPDTYVIERVADIVLNPSQEVFGDSQNELNVEYTGNKPVSEVIESIKENTTTNFREEIAPSLKENKHMADTSTVNPGVSKLEEKKFRKDIQTFLEDASKLTDPHTRMQELTEILTYFQDGTAADLRESVEKQINEEKEKLEKLIQEASKTKEVFGTSSPEDLKTGVALLAEEVRVVEAEAKDWEAIALIFKEKNESLKAKLEEVSKELETRPKVEDVTSLKETVELFKTQRDRFSEATKIELKEMQDRVFASLQRTKIAEARVADLEKIKEQFEKAQTENATQSKKIEMLTEASSMAKKAAETITGTLKEATEKIKALENQIARLQTALEEEKKNKETLQQEFDSFKEKIEEEKKPKIMPRYEERAKGHFNFNEEGVENYWKDLVVRHGDRKSVV